TEVNFNYTEANAWQYEFGAHHDIEGIIECLNLNDSEFIQAKNKDKKRYGKNLEKKLDSLFLSSSKMTGRDQSDITGLIGQYAHGNEPSHHVAYLYDDCNRNDKCQLRVQEIINKFYTNAPEGLCGNEDCGQMSAWYVFSCLGFYPVNPIISQYHLGIPQFQKVQIKLPNEKPILFNSKGIEDSKYLSKVYINEKEQRKEIQLKPGDQVKFEFSYQNYWQEETPLMSKSTFQPMPYISSGEEVFMDSTLVQLGSFNHSEIEYSFDTSLNEKYTYKAPISIYKPLTLFFRNRTKNAPWLVSEFKLKPRGFKYQVMTKYDQPYNAGGEDALFNGIDGSLDFRDGHWQGFWGKDIEIMLEIQEGINPKDISIRCLQDQGSWILFPSKIEIQVSKDGKNFKRNQLITNTIEQDNNTSRDHIFRSEKLNGNRFIKLIIYNPGKLPTWHLSAGSDSWVFMDEIKVNFE
ncbi:MAG: glycoside hydrolase domain-containing protein, partial [Saprospiraceae bacterium]